MSRDCLWFYPRVPFALKEFDRVIKPQTVKNIPSNDITLIGLNVTRKVLALDNTAYLMPREDYFRVDIETIKRGIRDSDVAAAETEPIWLGLLKPIVSIIREETGNHRGELVSIMSRNSRLPQWHVPLLRQLRLMS